MLSANAYAQYNRNKILTASPAELTLMLYDGCIKFINIAKMGIDEKDLAKANTNIKKAERIIVELQSTLNEKYEVAKDFNAVYSYVKRRLLEANIAKDNEILEECAGHMRTMRDTWKEVMKTARQGERVVQRA
ncbi:MAG: flagellar export chaperone FliS [Lachnospiraceae bacterium]|jgi:flagellar protein FliS|nr:flagellar export chaperone FliS [Lachnospiraceae bacterium]